MNYFRILIDDILYAAFEHGDFILAIITLCLEISVSSKRNEKWKQLSTRIMLVLTVAMLLNYIGQQGKRVVPNVTNMTYSFAQASLRDSDLNDRPIGYSGESIHKDNPIVSAQTPLYGTRVNAHSDVCLYFGDTSANIEINADNEVKSDLSLKIGGYSVFYDGYYYEYPDTENPESTCFIDFKAGIYGTYEYSRALSEAELANWFHGGKLYDADGNEIGVEGNYPSFWANSNRKFAVEFPEGLSAGTYTYELYQYVDGQYVSDSINFTVE